MDAGPLNKRITIEAPTYAQDAYGAEVPTWATWATTWASVEPGSSTEPKVADAYTPQTSYVFTIRYRAGLLPSYRIRYGSRTFGITGIKNPAEANVTLVIDATEVV
jgi:SPP1 family predicted phage head-tail adaptor